MSFGPSNTTKTAQNNLAGVSNVALNEQYPAVTAAGSNLLNLGNQNTQAGTNFLSTLLQGNAANTTAALAPNIAQTQGNNTNLLNAINTLTPRGGGRSSALFSQSLAPSNQITNLFNSGRTTAAQALPQIGAGQTGAGTNLFGIGTNTLGAATGANSSLQQGGLQQQQISNNLASGVGAGLLSILGLPLSGGTSVLGKLFGMG